MVSNLSAQMSRWLGSPGDVLSIGLLTGLVLCAVLFWTRVLRDIGVE